MTPLVLIPGMMCDARLYAPQIAALNRRPVMVAPCTEGDSMAGLAAAVLAAAPPRFALAGLSMGGIVAMEVVRQAPDRVERLCLMDTNAKAESDAIRATRGPQVDRVMAGGLETVMRDEMMPAYLDPGADRPDIRDLCLDMALALGPEVFARQSQALATRPDQQATLAAWTGPALVLCGAADRLCPLHRHEAMHALMPQSRLAVIAGAGHLPTLEQPEATTAEIRAWLDA
ncbi:MAG: alpha/beta fold hydrolase [Gemmobacter sp.]